MVTTNKERKRMKLTKPTGRRWMGRSLIVAAAIAAAVCAEAAQKKAIGCGWGFNNVTVDDFLANADRFNETGLDGVLVWMRGKDGNGKPVGMRNIYYEDWTYEMFAPMVPAMTTLEPVAEAVKRQMKVFRPACRNRRRPWLRFRRSARG